MAHLPLASAVRAAQPLTGPREPAPAPSGAPAEAIPCPADVILDALKLRSEANANSPLNPAFKLARAISGAKEGDKFEAAYGASGVIDKLAPTFSRSILGAGLNVLVVGTGAQQAGDRHRAFVEGVDATLKQKEWGFGAVYNLTSLTQQVAVFWRTMANSTYKAGTWLLKHAARVRPLAGPAARVSKGLAVAAATPAGRALAFLNKWIPLLNAAWVMLAAKTAWDVHHDAKSSATSKALALGGVGASVAAVVAGIYLSGAAFLAVTAGSIVADLLLAESRHRDQADGDTDALARRWTTHPFEGLAAGGRWTVKVARVIAGRAKHVLARLRGEEVPQIVRPTRRPAPSVALPTPGEPPAPPKPSVARPVDPRARLKVR